MRKNLMTGTAGMIQLGAVMSDRERKLGRFIRDESGHAMNNTQQNPPPPGIGESTNNNSRQEFDPAQFWNQPTEEPVQQPNQNGNQDGNQTTGNESNNQLGTQIASQIQGFKVADVFTQEAVEGINEGDFSKFHGNLEKMFQTSMQQNVEMTVGIMKQFGERIMALMDEKINSGLTNDKNYSALHQAIPSAKNPSVAPIVKSIYDRALTLSGGDSTKAIQMTKTMLKSMASETGADTGLDVAPVGADSTFGRGSRVNWLEELNQA